MNRVRPTTHRRSTAVSIAALAALAGLAGVACGGDDGPTADATVDTAAEAVEPHRSDARADRTALLAATLATADFQDVDVAEVAGYLSTIDGLGCFHDADRGGMGLHHLNEALLDDQLDPAAPEALVYEPPSVLGLDLHEHSTLPLWVLHAWIWKDNPAGTFEDFNPAVRSCPDGVPVFGVDLP